MRGLRGVPDAVESGVLLWLFGQTETGRQLRRAVVGRFLIVR